jgi:hypothetical protein
MIKFVSLKTNCPICSGARRDCRQNRQTDLIHCRHDVIGAPPGFRFIGVDSIGFNMWAADDGRERDWSKWEVQRQQRVAERERRLTADAERYAQSLDADERDRNIKRIHAQLGLSTQHRRNLQDRGLTDAQIEAGKFFSITPWQEVTAINPRLAGVDLYGRKLLIGQSGFACPVYDVQGRLIGWQTRFDDATDNKYKWVTSQSAKRPNGATSHLQNGEMPISCCRPVSTERNSIGLAEGFLKSYITAQRWGQVIIGAAGGNFAGSPQQLKAYLEALSSELGTETVDLYPDGGAVTNNAVIRHYERAIQMISEWGYSVRVAWWGQLTKEQPDIDELPSFDSVAYLTPEEFLELGKRGRASAHSFTGLLGWLPRLARRFQNQQRAAWGFGRKGEVEVEPLPATPETLKYDKGDRHNIWQTAAALGYRHILDTSTTGTGKSFDAGLLTPELFDARQIIYVSKDHRNPTTGTLKDWHDLEARHKGLYRDEFDRLRRVDKQQSYVVPPNCGRNQTITALRSKNIAGADTAELVCTTCPHFEPCRAGKVFGFLNQRAEALKQPRLRAHPDSLPSPEEYDYSHVTLIWEEAGEIIQAHRSIEVKTTDVSRVIATLLNKLPETFDVLRPLLTTLHRHISGEIKQPNKYGWGDAQIRQALPELGNIDIDAIRTALTPDPSGILNHTQEYGVDAADLPRGVRKKVTPADKATAERIGNELALDWLPDFLDVLLGNQIGSLRIQYGILTMTLGDERQAGIVNAAGCNIYLDATAIPEDIIRPLRITDDKQLLVTQQVTQDTNNLEVIQVTTLGRLGLSQRSDYCSERVDAVINQIQTEASGDVAVIDFKRHTQSGDGKRHWWVDSRGVNDLENCSTLILTGTPCPNLGVLEAAFTLSYGRAPIQGTERVRYRVQLNGQPADFQEYFELDVSADPEFREFVRRHILAAYHQAIGRLRAHRRPGESLKVYIVADYPLDFPVTRLKASDMTSAAASKIERVEIAIRAAISQLQATGQKITQSAIAAVAGFSQGYISRFRKLLQTLLDDSYSKSNNSGEPPPDPDDIGWASQTFLPLLADQPPDELLNGVLNTFESHGKTVFKRIWDVTAAAIQIKILETLLLTLPAGELRALQLALEACF